MRQYGVGYQRGQGLNDADQHTPEHSASKVADATKHRCCKGKQTKLETKIENCSAVLQTIDEPGRSCQRRTNKKGDGNDTVNVHAHQRSRLTVLRNGTHGAP